LKETAMSAPDAGLEADFKREEDKVVYYGKHWWEHDPGVQDRRAEVSGLSERLAKCRDEKDCVVSTQDVYKDTQGESGWPEDWCNKRRSEQMRILGMLPQKDELRGQVPNPGLAYITLGLPGSGKTRALRKIAWNHYEEALEACDRGRRVRGVPPGAAVLDADEIRVLIKEYKDGVGSTVVQPETATLTHGPAKDSLLKPPKYISLSGGGYSGILFDTVGDPRHTPKDVRLLVGLNFRVHVLLARVDFSVAERRIMRRCVENGRYVDPLYLLSRVGVPEQALGAVVHDGLPVEGWGVWDTSADDVAPLLVDGPGLPLP
jgi:hypothetical protein